MSDFGAKDEARCVPCEDDNPKRAENTGSAAGSDSSCYPKQKHMIAGSLSAYDLRICISGKGARLVMGATKANSAIVHAGFDAKEGRLTFKSKLKRFYEMLFYFVFIVLGSL